MNWDGIGLDLGLDDIALERMGLPCLRLNGFALDKVACLRRTEAVGMLTQNGYSIEFDCRDFFLKKNARAFRIQISQVNVHGCEIAGLGKAGKVFGSMTSCEDCESYRNTLHYIFNIILIPV